MLNKVEGFSYVPFFDWLRDLQANLKKRGFTVMPEPTFPPSIWIWREKSR